MIDARIVNDLLDLATNGDIGRGEGDEVYKRITEGRDFGKGYSSCGDLCHWLLFRLGVRLPFVNRAEFTGWKSGQNIARLCFSKAPSHNFRLGEPYEAGDILAIWNKADTTDAHVLVVRECQLSSALEKHGIVKSADYGQPGGERRTRSLAGQVLGNKKIMKVLRLRDVLQVASEQGALVAPQTAAEWLSGGNVA